MEMAIEAPMPPFLESTPRGAPIRIKAREAAGIEYFLYISILYLLMFFFWATICLRLRSTYWLKTPASLRTAARAAESDRVSA